MRKEPIMEANTTPMTAKPMKDYPVMADRILWLIEYYEQERDTANADVADNLREARDISALLGDDRQARKDAAYYRGHKARLELIIRDLKDALSEGVAQ